MAGYVTQMTRLGKGDPDGANACMTWIYDSDRMTRMGDLEK